ncbi:hypothetical protein HOH87_03115 [bacterium]|nr:hypothetical protein [bacterium]
MDNNKKAEALVALLGAKAERVLAHLPQEKALRLSEQVNNALPADPAALNEFVNEVMSRVSITHDASLESVTKQSQQAFSEDLMFDDKPAETVEFDIEEMPMIEEKVIEPETPEVSEVEEVIPVLDERAEKLNAAGEMLVTQPLGMIAFVIKMCQEPIKGELLKRLPDGMRKKVEAKEVVVVPFATKVFKAISAQLFPQ